MPLDPRLKEFSTQLSLYELLTYVDAVQAARAGKSISASAADADRGTSAYTRVLQALNGRAKEFFGEALLEKPRKGKNWIVTATGDHFYEFGLEIQECFQTNFSNIDRLALARPVHIAMQQLSLMDILRIENGIQKQLAEGNAKKQFKKTLEHVSSEDFPSVLLKRSGVDFAFGGLIDEKVLAPGLEFILVEKRPYVLISNFDFRKIYKLPDKQPVTVAFLKQNNVPLVIAQFGVIVDFLVRSLKETRVRGIERTEYLKEICRRYNIVEVCNDVHFVIELLCTTRARLCMFGTMDIFQRATERAASEEVRGFCNELGFDPPEISYQEIAVEFPQLHVGVIRRRPPDKGANFYDQPDHPMRLFWEEARKLSKRAGAVKK